MEFDYQDDKIINDEHTIAELPWDEYIKKDRGNGSSE